MSATQLVFSWQVSRIDFQEPATSPDSDSHPCRLYFTKTKLLQSAGEENNSRPKPNVLLTHGAESQLDKPSLDIFAQGLASTHTVLCFEDRESVQERASTFTLPLDACPSVTAFGGRSLGSIAAVEALAHSKVRKLILFSLPLSYWEGMSDPARNPHKLPRDMLQLEEDTEVLFVGGDKDELRLFEDLADMRKSIKSKSWFIRIRGAEHGIKFELEKRRSVYVLAERIAGEGSNGNMTDFCDSEKTADVMVDWNESW